MSIIKLIMSAFKRISTAITSPFRMLIVKLQRIFNVDVITAKLVSPLSKTIKSLFSLKPQSKQDYISFLGLWIYKKVFLLIVLVLCAGVFLYFTMFAPTVRPAPNSAITVKTTTTFSYKDMSVAKFSGVANIKAINDAIVYTGEILNGVCVGAGELFDLEGNLLYMGDFDQNQYNGKGTSYHKNKQIKYQGEFANNKYNGAGKLYDEDGEIMYEGNFVDGEYSGKGKSYFTNGELSYVGDFGNGTYNGVGTSYYMDGVVNYTGEFFSGKPQGTGTLYNAMGKEIYKGTMYAGKIEYRSLINANLEDVQKAFPETPKIYYTADYSCFVFEQAGVALTTDCIVKVSEWVKPDSEGGDENKGLYFPPDETTQTSARNNAFSNQAVATTMTAKPLDEAGFIANALMGGGVSNNVMRVNSDLDFTSKDENLSKPPDYSDNANSDNTTSGSTSSGNTNSSGTTTTPDTTTSQNQESDTPDFIDRSLSLYFQVDKGVWQSEEELDKTKVLIKRVAVLNDFDIAKIEDGIVVDNNQPPTLEECVAIEQLRKTTPTAFSDILFEIDRQNKLFVRIWNINYASRLQREVLETKDFVYKYSYQTDTNNIMFYSIEGR